MEEALNRRIKEIDASFEAAVLADFLHGKERTVRLIAEEPQKLPQSRHSGLAGDNAYIGLLSYALGYPLEEVRLSFLEAAKCYLKVFELRGTESPFPVIDLTIDPTKDIKDPAFVISSEDRYPPEAKDYSVTNSKKGFESVCLSLVGHDYGLAEQLASMIWDPPNATYIGATSEVCTFNEQHLGYAVRELFAAKVAACVRETSQIKFNKIETDIFCLGKMIRAIAEQEREAFLQALYALLQWHEKEAKRKQNLRNPEFYLNVRGLGTSILAIRRGVIRMDQLPEDNPYLPLELVKC